MGSPTKPNNLSTVLQPKPNEVRFNLPLNLDITRALKDTFQEKIYLLQLEKNGQAKFYHLKKVDNEDGYYLLDQDEKIVPTENVEPVYAYVILQHDEFLELRLGKANHFFLADRSDVVVAAGDIYFDKNDHSDNHPERLSIVKFTNQSGGYHFPVNDPLAYPGFVSSVAAMNACGLPMDKFKPVVPPKTLLFSNPFGNTKLDNRSSSVIDNNQNIGNKAITFQLP